MDENTEIKKIKNSDSKKDVNKFCKKLKVLIKGVDAEYNLNYIAILIKKKSR